MNNFLFLCLLLNLSTFSQEANLMKNYNFELDSCSYNVICNGSLNYLKAYDCIIDKDKVESDQFYNSLNSLGLYSFCRARDSFDTKSKKTMFNIKYSTIDTFALESIIAKVKNKGVLIINEDHLRLETRVFNYNILSILKKYNFTHLAMEAFYNIEDTINVSFKNGYYFVEPIQAEIFRKAKELGFQLVKYDTFIVDPAKRDSLQAFNLYKVLNSNNKIKMVVIAGQSHGADDCLVCPPLMGSVLKEKYCVDPVTIDQTRGIEFSSSLDLSFEGKVKNCFVSSDIVKKNLGFGMFDYFYIHPKYSDFRDWYTKIIDKKMYFIKSKIKYPALVQVYHKSEFDRDSGIICTPVENITRTIKNGILEVFLRPKKDYIIVYRDSKNRILKIQAFKAK